MPAVLGGILEIGSEQRCACSHFIKERPWDQYGGGEKQEWAKKKTGLECGHSKPWGWESPSEWLCVPPHQPVDIPQGRYVTSHEVTVLC